MAKKIYIGNMLEQMQTAISSLETNMTTMSGDMANMVSEIISLKDYTSSGIIEIPVEVGNDHIIIFNDVQLTNTGLTEQIKASFNCMCSGAIGINAEIKSYSTSYWAYLSYRINGGSWVVVGSIKNTEFQPITFTLGINKGDLVDISLRSSGNGFAAYLNAGMSANYNIMDIIGGTSGALSIV